MRALRDLKPSPGTQNEPPNEDEHEDDDVAPDADDDVKVEDGHVIK